MNSMMKHVLAAVALATAATAQAQWGIQVLWGSDYYNHGNYTGPDCFDPDGNPIPLTSNWAAQIIDAVTETVYYTAHHHPEYGFWRYEDPLVGVPFQLAMLPPAADGRQLRTRIFNHDDPNQATMFAIVGPGVVDWNPNDPLPPLAKSYNFGKVLQSDWQVIPEPGSAGLLLLGAGVFLIRRARARAQR